MIRLVGKDFLSARENCTLIIDVKCCRVPLDGNTWRKWRSTKVKRITRWDLEEVLEYKRIEWIK